MPDSTRTLILFVLLVLPGLVYNRRRETRLPPGTLSAFRETANTLVVGVTAQVPVLAAVLLGRWIAPGWTVDLRLAFTAADSYLQEHFALAATWTMGAAALACSLAALWAIPPAWLTDRLRWAPAWARPSGVGLSTRQAVLPGSGWTESFEYFPDHFAVVGCAMKSGRYLEGSLGLYNRALEESGDRDLVLRGPISYRETSDDDLQLWEGPSQVIVSARDIEMITVRYEPVVDGEPEPI